MVDHLACPQASRLSALLDATNPARDLLDHLARCRQCQNALECIAVGESGWLRSPPARDTAESPHHLMQVLSALKQFPTAADLLTVPPEDLSLDFLAPTDHPEALGAIGPYPVLEVVGRGGMGVVFRALDRALNRIIAVKVLAPQWAANGTARQRFLREARAAAAVAHEHVVNIHAVDESNGLTYLVMEYVPGMSLQERIDRDGPLDAKDIARIALQVAEGLAAAHAQGLVHRDVKPANILLENGVGRARLSDFGLARAVDDASSTQHGTITGTPDYMAPEQAAAQVVDHRADLYSLGSVIYAMSTGRPPFRAPTALGVLHLTATAAPLPIRAVNPDIPPDLEAVALRLLAKSPADRIPTAEAVAAELRAVLVRMQQPIVSSPRRHWRWWGAAGVSLLLAAIAGSVIFTRPREENHASVPIDSGENVRPTPVSQSDKADPPESEEAPVTSVTVPAVVRTFEGHRGSVRGLAVHPDGKRLVSVTGWPRGDGTIRIWDIESGRELHRIPVGPINCDCVTLTPSGDTIIAGFTDGTVRLYEWNSETEMVRLSGEFDITCVAAAPFGRRIAVGDINGRVRVWDPATGRVQLTIFAHAQRHCRAVAFSPDGKLIATAGLDSRVRTWDASTGQMLTETLNGAGAWGLAFADSGQKLLTSGIEVAVWDASGRRQFDLRDGKPPSTRYLKAVAVSRDGTAVAACGLDGLFRVWDFRTTRLRYRASADIGALFAVAFTPDGKYLLTGGGAVFRNGDCAPGNRFTIRMWAVASE